MKNKLLLFTAIVLFFLPKTNYGQAPSLGSSANFVLFTSVGAVTNTGISQITGNIGSNVGTCTNFGNINGTMQSQNLITAACSTDVLSAYNQLNGMTPTNFPASTLGGDTLLAGVYSITGASSLSNTLTLNAQGNPNAVFIFKLQGAFSVAANAKVVLMNGALASNVFWKIEGLTSLSTGVTMRGTIITNNGAISISAGDTLEGRALTTAGAISVDGILAYIPLGNGIPLLTGPIAPTLGATANYVLFSGIGAVSNSGVTQANGDIGTNSGLTTGFNPLLINGEVHAVPDGSTNQCATDLATVYAYLNSLSADIELLYPAQFGNNLTLTPHTYLLNAATSFTDTLYLNAQGNPNAVFVIKIYGALTTSTYSKVLLINGTQARNVYWLVSGAVSINNNSVFEGTIICNNGAINFAANSTLHGRALTTVGAVSVSTFTAFAPNAPYISSVEPINALVGSTVTITGFNFSPTTTNNMVFFGATMATVVTATANSLTVIVPIGANNAYVTELNLTTNLSASSLQRFNPIYSPVKEGITINDFMAKQDFANGSGSNPLSIAIGDLNADGKPDLAVANYGTSDISVFINTATSGQINSGSFAAKQNYSVGGPAQGIAIGDLDADGKPDLAIACNGYVVSVLRNTSSSGTLSFASKVDFTTNQNATSVVIGDLDEDGRPEMVVTNATSNNISIYQNLSTIGNIAFANKIDFAVGNNPKSVCIGDIDGDGKVDITVANTGSNNVSVFLNTSNTGGISLVSKVDFTTGTAPNFVTLGDFNGDTKLDLAITNQNDNSVSILKNTSSVSSISFATKVDFTTGTTPTSIALGDLDGDSKVDLVVSNQATNTVSVLRNNSNIDTISFNTKVDFTTGNGTASVAVGDLDGDEKPDIAIANSIANSISILRNDDIKIYYSQNSGNPAILSNWNSEPNGSGYAPSSLTICTRYIIQSSHTLTTTGNLLFGTLGSKLEIQNGGILTASLGNAITFANGSTLQIEVGGLFNSNTNQTVGNLNLVGGKFNIGTETTLILNNIVTTAGVLSGSATSNLTIGASAGTLLFNQTTPGVTNVIHHLIIGTGTTSNIVIGNALNIDPIGSISFNSSGTKSLTTTGQTLTLLSSAAGSAMIDNTNNATIVGNITVQNYLPANGRQYRFLSSQVIGGTTLQWRDNAANTSGVGIAITGHIGTVDASITNQPSAFYYDENNTNEGTNINGAGKWPNIDGNTTLTNGKGYRVFVRGDRTISLTTANSINNATTIWIQGTYPSNPVSPNITYTPAAANGWNLIGNPYPCTIDWGAIAASDRTNLDNAIYVWNPSNTNNSTGGYASFVNGVGTGTPNAGSQYISSGQAFFVKANASSPVLNFREVHKQSNQAGGRMFKSTSVKPNSIRLKLFKNNTPIDDAVLYFQEEATRHFDSEFDAYDLTNNIGFLTANGKDTLAISGNPIFKDNETYKINANLSTSNYQFQFTDLTSFTNLPEAYLIDNYLNKKILLADSLIYAFSVIDNNPYTFGNNRFELQFGKSTTSITSDFIPPTKLLVYPNPATHFLNLSTSNNKTIETINIYNVSGKLILHFNTNLNQIDISQLNSGVYFIEVFTINEKLSSKFIK